MQNRIVRQNRTGRIEQAKQNRLNRTGKVGQAKWDRHIGGHR